MSKKTAGILLHLTSLPNQFSIGDLGDSAYRFVDFLAKCKFRWWQVLPVGFTGKGNSPYQSPSAFGGNPLLLDMESFVQQNLLKKTDLKNLKAKPTSSVNFEKAARVKSKLLEKAFLKFELLKTKRQETQFQTFITQESYWIHDFALFFSLQNSLKQKDWTKWPSHLKRRHPQALLKATQELKTHIRFHQFVQWQFSQQWEKLHTYCKKKGIKIIGDIPMFLHHASHDVWAHQKIFKLLQNGNSKFEAAIEPDQFSATGQLWEVPVYNWKELKKQKYEWWIERFKISYKRFDELRLDHFIGFTRTYEVHAGSKTAANGKYREHDGQHFFNALKKNFKRLNIFVDDLGRKTPRVRALHKKIKAPVYQVLQYDLNELLKKGKLYKFPYRTSSFLYIATHDHDTVQGWYHHLTHADKKLLCALLNTAPKRLHWTLIEIALNSAPKVVLIQMQDILGLSSKDRMNTPGTVYGNWKWRLDHNVFRPKLIKQIHKLLVDTKRIF